MDTAWEAESDQRRLMNEDYCFISKQDGMWEGSFSADRRAAKMTFDMITPIINQTVSEQRYTRIGVRVLPVSNDATQKLADKRAGVIRAIQEDSDASDHYARAFEESVICGFGGLRVKSVYCDDEAFEQELRIEHVSSARENLFLDPASMSPDGSDAYWGIVTHDYTEEQFQRDFGNAQDADNFGDTVYEWKDTDTDRIRVAEYYWKEPVTTEIVLTDDGSTYDLADIAEQALEEAGLTIIKRRKSKSHKVYKAVLCGNRVLEGKEETVFKSIPLIPVYGITRMISGKRYYQGMVQKAKDANRMLNWSRSKSMEDVEYAPTQKFVVEETAVASQGASISNINNPAKPLFVFKADPSLPNAGLPQVMGGSIINQGLENQSQQAMGMINQIVGHNPAAMDISQTQMSGRAIDSLTARADTGAAIYQDNLMIAIERVGELCNQAIPYVYPEARQLYIVGEDGERVVEAFNSSINDQVVNDLSIGKYKVLIEAGATHKTQRRETAERLQQLIAADPMLLQTAGDLLVKNLDLGDGGALANRMRKQAIANGIIDQDEMTEDEREEMAATMEANQAQQQQQAELAQIDVQLTIKQRELELAELEAKIRETNSKTGLNEAKTITEGANIEKIQAETAMAASNPEKTSVVL